ncbi:MAG: NAD(P)-binding domain-containing protein [Holophaga sp.]|jgi:3-hydroxyisobutyrate dehydrogenase-like beta-hydroxyacid dehydrogenase
MQIAILGTGRMGAPMARNLLESGHGVTVHDRTPEKAAALGAAGAQVAASAAEAVRDVQVALTMVPGDVAETALVFGLGGLLQHLPPGAIHLCMSTISVEASRRLAAAHQEAGQGYVAAPVLGNPDAALARHLWILAAGPDLQVNRCLGILERLGRGITRVGSRPELAHALKLGAHLLNLAVVEALAEVLAYGEKAGYPAAEYLRTLNLGLFRSPLLDALGGFMVRRDHEPFDLSLDLAAQDLEALLRAARDLQAAVPMAGPLLQEVRAAQAEGLGARDLTALSVLRRRTGGGDPGAGPEPPRPAPRKVPAAGAAAIQPERPPGGGVAYPARDGDRTVSLDLWRTSHFEDRDGTVWAWVDGQPHATSWRTLGEVERALGQVLLVRIQPGILLSPQAVLDFKPALGGRARVSVAGGLQLTASRDATRRLKHLLGL